MHHPDLTYALATETARHRRERADRRRTVGALRARVRRADGPDRDAPTTGVVIDLVGVEATTVGVDDREPVAATR